MNISSPNKSNNKQKIVASYLCVLLGACTAQSHVGCASALLFITFCMYQGYIKTALQNKNSL